MKKLAAATGKSKETTEAKETTVRRSEQLFTTLQQHFHPGSHSGILHVQVPDKDEAGEKTNNPLKAKTWRDETEPQRVEDIILNRNIEDFSQAKGTPFTISPLLDAFEFTDTTAQAENLLDREFSRISKIWTKQPKLH